MFFVRAALSSGSAEAAKLTIKKAQLMACMLSIYFLSECSTLCLCFYVSVVMRRVNPLQTS